MSMPVAMVSEEKKTSRKAQKYRARGGGKDDLDFILDFTFHQFVPCTSPHLQMKTQ